MDSVVEFSESLLNSGKDSVSQMVDIAWDVLWAVVILLLGWISGEIIQRLFAKIDKRLKFFTLYQKSGFADLIEKAKLSSGPSEIVGMAIKGFIITLSLRWSVKILGLIEVEEFLTKVINFIPNVVIALFIILFTVRFSQTAGSLVENLLYFSQEETKKILAGAAKNILITFGIMAALVQLKIADELIQTLFTAFVAMIALAGGLAIGLGAKEFVHDALKEFQERSIQNKKEFEKDHKEEKEQKEIRHSLNE